MLEKFTNKAEYDAADKPNDESRVGLIVESNEVVVDGINVHVRIPKEGDLVFKTDNGIVYIDYLTAVASKIPSTYTHVGYVLERKGNYVEVIVDTGKTAQWLGAWQYAITEISATNITIGLRMSNDYGHYTNVNVTLSSTEINATTAQEISEAVSAKAEEVGDANPWWAWYDEANSRIIVQTDTDINPNQSSVAGTNCTISLCVYRDMKANNQVLRKSGISTTNCVGEIGRFVTYYSTHGTTPTSEVLLHSGVLVTKVAFEESEYCHLLRDAYGDYTTYCREEFSAQMPSQYGVFSLPSNDKYANIVIPTKDGGEMAIFSAMYEAYKIDFDIDGMREGDFHLTTAEETLAELSILSTLRASATKVGKSYPSNSTHRWTSNLATETRAWFFNGTHGNLYSSSGSYALSAFRVRAVTLLKLT